LEKNGTETMVHYTNKENQTLVKMIKIKKTVANGFYLFQGKASANSSFIEDLDEAKQFIILANYYFKGYLKIYDYLLTQDGWSLIVKINSRESIQKTSVINIVDGLDEDMIWRIISERMRIFLSTFVKFTNKKQRRTGGKVHSSYERFMFESLKEALAYMGKLRKGLIQQCQNRRKYRAKKSHYKIPKKLGKGSIFLSSRKLKKRIRKYKKRLETLEIRGFKKHVLQELIRSTINHTIRINSSP